MSAFLDKIINFIKWPVGIYMLISLPALVRSVDFFSFASFKFMALSGGFFMYFIAKTMSDSSIKTSMQIIAHELTHSFFALITFHKVNHIRLNPDESGGEMGFTGKGNWLIIIAPYFFPLFCFVYMVVMQFLPQSLIWNGMLGYFLGYHTDTIGSQIHEKQTDLPKVGYPFCFIFLPGANFFVIGSILAFNAKSWQGISTYFDLINRLSISYFTELISLLF